MPFDGNTLAANGGERAPGATGGGSGNGYAQLATGLVTSAGQAVAQGGSASGIGRRFANMFGGGQGGASGALSGAASGATMGMAAGPWGAAAGAVVGGVIGLTGGGGRVVFAGQSEVPHRIGPNIALLDLSNYNKSDGEWFLQTALANQCAVEDIAGVINMDREWSKNDWGTVVSWLKNHPGEMPTRLQQYYAAHPGIRNFPIEVAAPASQQPISAVTNQPLMAGAGAGAAGFGGLPAPGFTPVQMNGVNAGDPGWLDYLKAMGNGAVNAGTGVFMGTQAGKDIKKAYVKDWVKENQLLVAGGTLLLGGLTFFAFKKK